MHSDGNQPPSLPLPTGGSRITGPSDSIAASVSEHNPSKPNDHTLPLHIHENRAESQPAPILRSELTHALQDTDQPSARGLDSLRFPTITRIIASQNNHVNVNTMSLILPADVSSHGQQHSS